MSLRSVGALIVHHLLGLACAYGAAVLALGAALSLGMLGYGLRQVFECGAGCGGATADISLLAAALSLPIAIVLTIVSMTLGAAVVLAMPPFLVVPAYVLAVMASKVIRRSATVAMLGAVLGPAIGMPILVVWHHFAGDPAYRGSLLVDFTNLSAGSGVLSAVAGASIGLVIARRERSGSRGIESPLDQA